VKWHKTLLDWLGGAIGRTAGTGLAGGLLFIAFGMTPAELAAWLLKNPPAWLMSGWTRLLLVILGIAAMFASVRLNIWSEKQKAVDGLAEDISWAIHHLVNWHHRLTPDDKASYPAALKEAFHEWCTRVSTQLENRAFFTRADQLHFDRLGFIPPVAMTQEGSADHTLGMLKLKIERLRDVIMWVQQRPR
jgi:hypothetical protein